MTAASVAIRPAVAQDAPAIADLLASIGWFASYQTGTVAEHARAIANLIHAAKDRSLLLVATAADSMQVVGYCATHWLPTAILQGWDAYVSELFIADNARGAGIGAQLLDHAVQAAREKDCGRIWLVNNRDRDSYQRSFYAQQGWQEHPQSARFVLTL